MTDETNPKAERLLFTLKGDATSPAVGEAVRAEMRSMADHLASCAAMYIAVCEMVADACRRAAEHVASLPEEEREELRRAAEDAPLCPVDVIVERVM